MFVCEKCGDGFALWSRSCPTCSAENSLVRKAEEVPKRKAGVHELSRLQSCFTFFNSVFGGFLVPFLYLFRAAPGAGKTTFLLQVCAFLVSRGIRVLFFSFDEGEDGIRKKWEQYGLGENLPDFVFEYSPNVIEKTIREVQPSFVVGDTLHRIAAFAKDKPEEFIAKLKRLAIKYRFALAVITEERKDMTSYLGSVKIGYIVDVEVKMVNGPNDDVMISSPNKNRDTDDHTSRCFFKRTPAGLIEIDESDTGYLQRHNGEKEKVGLAPFVATISGEFFVEEITAAILDSEVKKPSLTIAGMSQAKARNLLAVIDHTEKLDDKEIMVRANKLEKLNSEAELACVMSILSKKLERSLPVNNVFIGGVDNLGNLLPVDGMEQRVKRAKALGYKRIIGPRAIGSQTAVWEEFGTLESLKKEFFR